MATESKTWKNCANSSSLFSLSDEFTLLNTARTKRDVVDVSPGIPKPPAPTPRGSISCLVEKLF